MINLRPYITKRNVYILVGSLWLLGLFANIIHFVRFSTEVISSFDFYFRSFVFLVMPLLMGASLLRDVKTEYKAKGYEFQSKTIDNLEFWVKKTEDGVSFVVFDENGSIKRNSYVHNNDINELTKLFK